MSESGLGPLECNGVRILVKADYFFAIVPSHPESLLFFPTRKSEHQFLLSSSIPVSALTLHYPTYHVSHCPLLVGEGLVDAIM